MKKLFATLVVLLPVFYVAGMILFLYISPDDEVLFTALGGFLVLGLIINCVFCAVSAKADRKFLSVCNIGCLATNLMLYIAEIVYLLICTEAVRIAEQNGGMEGGLGIALLIVVYMPHWFVYLFTRILTAVNCERALKGVCTTPVKTFLTILHLFPMFDILSAAWVLHKVRKAKNTARANFRYANT